MTRHPWQSTAPSPDHWPKGVVPISLKGVEMIGVDSAGNLHWDGKPVAFRLGGWEKGAVWTTVVSALFVGLESALRIFGVLH